jgi:hypothetical protein
MHSARYSPSSLHTALKDPVLLEFLKVLYGVPVAAQATSSGTKLLYVVWISKCFNVRYRRTGEFTASRPLPVFGLGNSGNLGNERGDPWYHWGYCSPEMTSAFPKVWGVPQISGQIVPQFSPADGYRPHTCPRPYPSISGAKVRPGAPLTGLRICASICTRQHQPDTIIRP